MEPKPYIYKKTNLVKQDSLIILEPTKIWKLNKTIKTYDTK